jgi:hypothetical protein
MGSNRLSRRVYDEAGNAFAAALAGCATADFTPYVGAQQNWPTARGAIVASEYAVPAYYGYPPRPYIVLGYLDATTAPVPRSRMPPNLASPPGETFAQWRE